VVRNEHNPGNNLSDVKNSLHGLGRVRPKGLGGGILRALGKKQAIEFDMVGKKGLEGDDKSLNSKKHGLKMGKGLTGRRYKESAVGGEK